MAAHPTTPIRLAIVNDYEMVVAGVAAMLAPYQDRVQVVELASQTQVVSDVDVILYDTFGQVQGDGVDLEDLVRGSDAKVVIFSWNLQRDLVARAIEKGASGYLSKALPALDVVEAVEAVFEGKVVTSLKDGTDATPVPTGDWPGRVYGLTQREAEVLALITQGLSNQEIAERAYISINSVKTYIRSAYRKIGVTRRTQAVGWGIQHGFEPDHVRVFEPLATD